jgi:hypothetical protein
VTNPVDRFGVLVPAHRDGAAARTLVLDLLAAADTAAQPVTLVIADNGGNGDLAAELPRDERLHVVDVAARGPGYARSAAAENLVARFQQQGAALDRAWLVSLDADTRLEPEFLTRWTETIQAASADVLSGPSFFAPIEGGYAMPPDADAASGWLWNMTGFCEHFVGLVNVGGCNHAVRASVCAANDYYVQPTQTVDGQVRMVPGDDWDFGLRARLRGFVVERANAPTCLTSARRLAADPADFIAGRAYEKPFEPVSAPTAAPVWPPAEEWPTMVDTGRARIVAHFLMKAVLAGLPVADTLRWFLGEPLWHELCAAAAVPPPTEAHGWVDYRTELIARLFEPATFDLARRIGRRLGGVPVAP